MKRSTANVSKISGFGAVFVWPNEGVIISREYLALEPRMPMAILRMLTTTLLVSSTLLQLLLARQPTSLLGESVQKAVLAPDGIFSRYFHQHLRTEANHILSQFPERLF